MSELQLINAKTFETGSNTEESLVVSRAAEAALHPSIAPLLPTAPSLLLVMGSA